MELFKIYFISVRLIDLVDISIVSYIFYKVYTSVRNNYALRVIWILPAIFVLWKIVGWLGLEMLKSIMDEVIGLGAMTLLIIFSPEIRKILTTAGKNTIFDKFLRRISEDEIPETEVRDICLAFRELRQGKHGALIVILNEDDLEEVQSTGDTINADVSSRLLYAIFQKESPLHDGAVIIRGEKILKARCILPNTENLNLPPELGMRHRAAMGVSEVSDALVVVLSEERGETSLVQRGVIRRNIREDELQAAIDLFLHRK